MTDGTTKASEIEAGVAALGLSFTAVFVPWSRSRNAGESNLSLNWSVTLHHRGKPFFTLDYSAGCGHCPSYVPFRQTVDDARRVKSECETGCVNGCTTFRKPIKLPAADLWHSVASDASAIDYPNFEEWAEDAGYDTDSRSAEAMYRECLAVALALRGVLGEDGLRQLRELVQDY